MLKRQKLPEERAKLEQKLYEMNALKRKQKLAEKVFKNKKTKQQQQQKKKNKNV